MEETDLGSFDELFINLMMLAVNEEDVDAEDTSEFWTVRERILILGVCFFGL